jgi:hypothetical protein
MKQYILIFGVYHSLMGSEVSFSEEKKDRQKQHREI